MLSEFLLMCACILLIGVIHFVKSNPKRVKNYKEDIVIEGHYHQAKSYKIENQEYINIPSLCCQKSFTRFKNKTFLNENL